MYATAEISCPWCGSPTQVTLDCSAGSQDFVEDCMVCCSPMLVHTECDPATGEASGVWAVREND